MGAGWYRNRASVPFGGEDLGARLDFRRPVLRRFVLASAAKSASKSFHSYWLRRELRFLLRLHRRCVTLLVRL
jgi:hypothetical protein